MTKIILLSEIHQRAGLSQSGTPSRRENHQSLSGCLAHSTYTPSHILELGSCDWLMPVAFKVPTRPRGEYRTAQWEVDAEG